MPEALERHRFPVTGRPAWRFSMPALAPAAQRGGIDSNVLVPGLRGESPYCTVL